MPKARFFSVQSLNLFILAFAFAFGSCPDPIKPIKPLPLLKIDIAEIQGISIPATGKTPSRVITETDQYTGTVKWSPEADEIFAANTGYMATITLTAKEGYTLEGVTENFFTVEGADAANTVGSGIITAVFPMTGPPIVIKIAEIEGITIPAAGGIPSRVIFETKQYTGTVEWSPEVIRVFTPETEYTAIITLTAKDNFTLEGISENFFTVEGAQATNAASSGEIIAVFPATGSVVNLTISATGPANPFSPISATGNLTVKVEGFFNDDHAANVGLIITPVSGLTFSGHNTIGNAADGVKTFTVAINFYWTQVFDISTVDITITGLTNIPTAYFYSGEEQTVSVSVFDGQDISRAIPVNHGNIMAFNEYANTPAGLSRHYKLTENVVLTPPASGGSNWTAIGWSYGSSPFTGSFDGQGYTISNLTINDTEMDNRGMFGIILENSFVINTGLVNVSINGRNFTSGIAGENRGTVENCYITGNISGIGSSTGGIVGRNRGIVRYSYVSGIIHSTGRTTGGIVGSNLGTVEYCYTNGSISGLSGVSGLVGYNGATSLDGTPLPGIIKNCYFNGTVSSDEHGSGGIAGYNTNLSMIENCYATGSAIINHTLTTRQTQIGGITGASWGSILRNSVALNHSITLAATVGGEIGRVAGTDMASPHNYARSDMVVVQGTANKTIKPGLTTEDGASISTEQYNSQAWWQTASNWSTTDGASAWDFTNVWQWGAHNLPILRFVGGNQDNNGPQDPIIQAAFSNLTANGSAAVSTTTLTLTFDKDIAGFTANDITMTGSITAVNVALTKTAATGVYELSVSNISSSGEMTVEINKTGYTVIPSARTVSVYRAHESVAPGFVYPVTFTGQTETVNLSNLNSNDIFMVKVNASGTTVNASGIGNVQTSNDTLPRTGHPAAEMFNANPPPIDRKALQRPRASFIPPIVGDTRLFWVENSFNSGVFVQKQATLRATGQYGNVWVMDEDFIGGNGYGNRISALQAQTLAEKFDGIYPAATNILGYEYGGGPGGDGGKDGDPKVQILAYDIGGNVGGYFWAKDFYDDTVSLKSNLAEIFYINTSLVNSNPDFIYSALVHEFQHMINFNVKTVQQGVNSATWYNEMLSMMAEDLISPLIGVEPANSGHPIQLRIPGFLSNYYNNGITEWNTDYAGKYAFGAYLLRNYGGAELLKSILANNTTNTESVTAALNEFSSGLNFISALTRYGEAFIYSGSSMPQGVKTFDKTLSSTVNGISYTAHGFDIWNDFTQKGPSLLNFQSEMRPHSVTVHSANEWRNVTGNFTVTLEKPDNANVVFFLMVK